jgi:hypothetical protein
MTARNLGCPPRSYARICGLLYLYIIAAGTFAELFVRSRLIVAGDAAATAANILGHELLFRIGFTAELLHLTADVGVATILYALFRQVDRNLALLAAFMRLACDIVLAVASLSHFVALRLLKGGDFLASFAPEQLQSLALLALRLHGDGYAISLVFFAFACLALGYLILRSRLLPRAIGALMAIAGACYLVQTLAHFLAPAFGASLFPAIFVPIFAAELSLALWLTVKGVDVAQWEAAAKAPGR